MRGTAPWKLASNRISVTGTRGKTSLALIIHDELVARKAKSFCKVTGVVPLLCEGRERRIIKRRGSVRLYENLLDVEPADFCVMENHGISPYTARVFHELFVKPHIIAVTNIRLDHVKEFGRTREMIASSLSTTFRGNEIVLSGEPSDRLNDRLESRAKKVIRVQPADPELPGSEIPVIADEVLRIYGFRGVDVEEYLRKIKEGLTWKESHGIKFFDASKVNDPDSASMILRWLGEVPAIAIQLRRDRPGRTWAFLKMIKEKWVDYSKVIVAGEWSREFAKRVGGVALPDTCEGAEKVLEVIRGEGVPLFITGNRTGKFVKCLLRKLGVADVPLIHGLLRI